jgi:hypothetical protein
MNDTYPPSNSKPCTGVKRIGAVSEAEKKAAEARTDFRSWLQWKKQDGERAESVKLESEQISQNSHPDDFKFDANGAPVFKADQVPADGTDVQWMQPASLNDTTSEYKKRYAAARKKKLVGTGGGRAGACV